MMALFINGCAEAQNKKANKLYVEASMEASQFLDKAWPDTYSELNDIYTNAKEKLETILSKYPSSDIAVGLMSDQIKISSLTLKQFRDKEKIVNLMKDSDESPLSCALLVAETFKDEKEKIDALLYMAKFYAMVGQKEKVTYFLSQVFKSPEFIKTNGKTGVLRRIAHVFAEFGYFEHAITTAKTIDDANRRSDIIIEIICDNTDIMGKELAVQMLSKAVDVAKTSNTSSGYYFDEIFDKCIDLGLLDQAFEMVDLIDSAGGKRYCLLKIAEYYIETNQKEQARLCLPQTLDIIDGSYIDFAKAYAAVGEKQKAEKLLSRAVEECKEDYGYRKARLLGPIATQYTKIGQYENADQIFSQALKATDSIDEESTAIEAISYIVCEYADVLERAHATQLLLKVIEMIEPLRQDNYRYSNYLMRIASKLSDLDHFEKVSKMIKHDKFLNTLQREWDLQANIVINFIDHGLMDQAFELLQPKESFSSSLFFDNIFKNYSDHHYSDKVENIFVKLLEIAETASIEQYWLTGLNVLGYYAKCGLKEQELKLVSTMFKKVKAKASEDFIVEGLAETAVRYAKLGTNDQVANILSQILETAQNTNKNKNKFALLTVASSIYEKTRIKPNSRDKLVLHNIVSAIDPLVNL